MSQDTLFLAQDDGDVNKAAFFISTRNNSFQDLTEVVTGTNQCNTVAVNPVTGELFFNSFGRGITYRYNFKEGKVEHMGEDMGESQRTLFLLVAGCKKCLLLCGTDLISRWRIII